MSAYFEKEASVLNSCGAKQQDNKCEEPTEQPPFTDELQPAVQPCSEFLNSVGNFKHEFLKSSVRASSSRATASTNESTLQDMSGLPQYHTSFLGNESEGGFLFLLI